MSSLLSQLIDEINSDHGQVYIQKNLPLLEEEIKNVFSSITLCKSLQAAEGYFNSLEPAQTALAKLAFKEGLALSNYLQNFVRDFDRIDDQELKEYLFIKKGTYEAADIK